MIHNTARSIQEDRCTWNSKEAYLAGSSELLGRCSRCGSGHECAIPVYNQIKCITKTELPLGQVIKFLSPWYGVVRAPGCYTGFPLGGLYN